MLGYVLYFILLIIIEYVVKPLNYIIYLFLLIGLTLFFGFYLKLKIRILLILCFILTAIIPSFILGLMYLNSSLEKRVGIEVIPITEIFNFFTPTGGAFLAVVIFSLLRKRLLKR